MTTTALQNLLCGEILYKCKALHTFRKKYSHNQQQSYGVIGFRGTVDPRGLRLNLPLRGLGFPLLF